jgi:Outer membrane protein beta-barrel domain
MARNDFQGGIVRKCLGALAVSTALCLSSWAQDPAQPTVPPASPTGPSTQAPAPATQTEVPAAQPTTTPSPRRPTVPAAAIQYPRFEFFGGGTYAEAGFFNAGHWAGLKGWDASVGFNVAHWLAFVVDGGQYFGTTKIPTAVPTPFPTCPPLCPTTFPTFGVKTKAYDVLFGVQLSRRKSERWTPFGELLFGRSGVRGEVVAQGFGYRAVSSGLGLAAGAGADYKINQRFALRVKADYLETRDFRKKQDNFRVSVGVVIHSVRKKKRTLEDETQPE